MFHSHNRFNQFLCVLFFLTFSGCGGLGSGCGCSTKPLPAGGLPATQTLEGGGQVRVTPAGFQKLTSILPAVINQQLGNGFCLPQGSIGSVSFTGANYCDSQQGGACGGGNGCNVTAQIHPGSFSLSVTNAQALNLKLGLDVHAVVPMDGHIVWVPASCNMNVDGTNLAIDADINFGIDPATGDLQIHLQHINSFDSSGLSLSNCGLISGLGNLINDLLNSFVGDFVIQLLTPTFDNLIQGFLPKPLGIEGMVDVGSLLAQVSPGTQAEMEMRMVPGGYVQLGGGGMSLGLITGINSDWDPSTRTPALISEPALCVPPIPAPDFSQAPFSLPATARGTFQLNPAGAFLGSPDPASDLAIGIAKTTLDLGGHHAVTSGAMCLGVGTSFVSQLNLGTIGLLVPSLSELGSSAGNDPILLVTRPQKALTFDIGDGTMASPSLNIHIDDMEVDFYAFIYQRYVRAFTLALTLNVGVNLEFQQMPGKPATVTPQLVGLSAQNIQLKVLNSEFVRESPQQLEQVLPTVFDLALPLLGNALKPINVPTFAGFTLNDLRVQKVTTSQDDFLAIFASLGSSSMMRQVAETNPAMADIVRVMDKTATEQNSVPKAHTTATLRKVETPTPEVVRAALAGDGELVVFVRDEAGNTTLARIPAPFHGQPGTGGGCTCNAGAGGGPGAGSLLLLLGVAVVSFRRRRATTATGRQGGRALSRFFRRARAAGVTSRSVGPIALWLGITVVTSLVPGCSCGSKPGANSCEMTSDCVGQCPANQIPLCFDHMCTCNDDIPAGKIGPYSDVDKTSTGDAYVSAYAVEHGDLVVAKHSGGGRIAVEEWEWVDGVPAGPVVVPGSKIRGGIADAGPDVGMYTSIAVAPGDIPEVSYMDNDNGSLKFAAKFGGTWQNHVVDAGTGKIDPVAGGEITGMYSTITLRSDDGRPGIAYMSEVSDGNGVVRAELRYASAQTATPASTGDWMIQVVDTITLPPIDPNKPDVYPLPEGLGLFLDATRDPATNAPVIAYYDRQNGNLKLAQLDPKSGVFGTPVVLDGAPNGSDVGWYPSVQVDASGVVHVAYQSATHDDLLYINTKDMTPEVVDDGYRIVGTNPDGLPKPEFHDVGNDNAITVTAQGPLVVYQDSTSHELLMSTRGNSGTWQRLSLKGGASPWMGAYGFFNASVVAGSNLLISNWVVDQPNSDNWVEIENQSLTPQ